MEYWESLWRADDWNKIFLQLDWETEWCQALRIHEKLMKETKYFGNKLEGRCWEIFWIYKKTDRLWHLVTLTITWNKRTKVKRHSFLHMDVFFSIYYIYNSHETILLRWFKIIMDSKIFFTNISLFRTHPF